MRYRLFASVLMLAFAASPVPGRGADLWEPDGGVGSGFKANILLPGHEPQRHDLEAIGGIIDVDYFFMYLRKYNSYEATVTNVQDVFVPPTVSSFERLDYSQSVLQSAVGATTDGVSGIAPYAIRWMVGNVSGTNAIERLRVSGKSSADASAQYSITLRNTTLFCPRFNNTNSQVTVLIVQPALDGITSCDFSAQFLNEGGGLLGSYDGATSGLNTTVVSTPAVSGVANQKGAALIAHTCGYGGLQAKLVALEPATGFSFDTPCQERSQP